MKKLFIIVLACYGLIACQSTVNTLDNKNKVMQQEPVDISHVSTDGFLQNRLEVVRVDKKEQRDGLLKVQVTLKNIRTGFWSQLGSWIMGDNPYQIAYRFTWLDSDGMEVETATSTWIPKTIIPGDTVRVTAISPNNECKDFTLSLRENDVARAK